ncbi:hypothetical protein JCM10908_005957 [Rhodotorula pacifica]|uniref:uncharacterized protein n=1 Tax=Rhodotorula pacifica TaxID=1495444 RepID=UPI00317B6F25
MMQHSDEAQSDVQMQPEELVLSDSSTSSTELDSSSASEQEDGPPLASSSRPPAHYRPSRISPHGIPAARKSTFQRPANQADVRKRLKATKAAVAAGAASRKSRLQQPLVKQEEDLPPPSWPVSPEKAPQRRTPATEVPIKTEKHFDLTFPFSLKLRLEEIRLGADLASSRPIVELAVAFRHIDQSTRTASVAASSAFQLEISALTPHDRISCTVGADSLPQDIDLLVARRPLRTSTSTALSPDLCDIGIVATVSLPAQNTNYTGWLSLLSGNRVRRYGQGSTRRAQDGTQITLRWQADMLGTDEDKETLVDEGDVAQFLEEELRNAEAEWRRETAERAQRFAKLEAQSPPTYGSPIDFELPAKAPSPASLIPGLNSQKTVIPASPAFLPVPRYSYTSFTSRGVPVAGHRLESFPWISKWEDATAANKLVAQKYRSFLPMDTEDGPVPSQDDADFDWLRHGLVDTRSFQPPDNGRTFRDFRVLKRLLAQLAEDSRVSPLGTQHAVEKRAAALDLFRRRVGRSAQEVADDHRLISDEELFPSAEAIDWCAWCGAVACTVHACFEAYNRPTKTPPKQLTNKVGHCTHCGRVDCLMNSALDGMNPDEAPPDVPERLKGLDACTTSLILGHAVENIPPPQSPADRSPAVVDKSKWWKRNILQPWESYGYVPCRCVDVCDESCVCVQSYTYCDAYCACPTSCPRRFGGCTDRQCDKDTKCFCRDRGRECDPRTCGCTHAECKNSRIRLGHYKATCLVRSQIPGAGYGLAMLEPAATHDLLGVYGGELFPKDAPQVIQDVTIDNTAGSWRAHMAETNPVSYWFEVDNADAVDSVELGGPTRFINHDPELANVEPRVINIAGTHQVAIYVTKPLQAGDELFMNYGASYYPDADGVKRGAS